MTTPHLENGFSPLIIFQLLPRQTQTDIMAALNSASPTQILLIFVAILVFLDVVLLLIAMARFQRARLLLSLGASHEAYPLPNGMHTPAPCLSVVRPPSPRYNPGGM